MRMDVKAFIDRFGFAKLEEMEIEILNKDFKDGECMVSMKLYMAGDISDLEKTVEECFGSTDRLKIIDNR